MTPPQEIMLNHFGRMTLNQHLWKHQIPKYVGTRDWLGETVEVSLGPENPQHDLTDVLETAERLWSDQSGWKKRVEDYAAEQLLTNKNENWRREKEPLATREQLIAALQLYQINVDEGGWFSFYHIVGDFFEGHEVKIEGTLDKGFLHAQLPYNTAEMPRPRYVGNISTRHKKPWWKIW